MSSFLYQKNQIIIYFNKIYSIKNIKTFTTLNKILTNKNFVIFFVQFSAPLVCHELAQLVAIRSSYDI